MGPPYDANGGYAISSSSHSETSGDDLEEKDAAREASNEELLVLDSTTVDLMRTLVASRAGRLRQQPDRLGDDVSLLQQQSGLVKRQALRRGSVPQQRSSPSTGNDDSRETSSDSGTGSSELSLPTGSGSESGDSSSEDESMQALRIRSLGPMQKDARTDPKPGEITAKDLVRREVWFYFDEEQQGAAKRGAQRHTSTLRAGWNKWRVTKKLQGKCPLEITYKGSNGPIKINTLLDLNNYWVAGTEAVASTWALLSAST